jgi:hypothetical protein
MSDVRELISLEPDFSSSLNASRSWLKVNDDWLLIVAESESSILEVYTIKRDSDRRWSCSVRGSRSLANDPVRGDVTSSDGMVSNLAER